MFHTPFICVLNMAEERRFSLSMALKNLKGNKITILALVGTLVMLSLYVTNPILMFSASSHVTDDLEIFMNLLQNNTFEAPKKLSKDFPVRFDFTSSILPQKCLENNTLGLGANVFLCICSNNNNNNNKNNASNVIIDIRKFTGNIKTGIKPTIVGINLNVEQWNVIKSSTTIIDEIVFG